MDEFSNTSEDKEYVKIEVKPEHLIAIIDLFNELVNSRLLYVVNQPKELYFKTLAETQHPNVVGMMRDLLDWIPRELDEFIKTGITAMLKSFIMDTGVSVEELEYLMYQTKQAKMARQARNN